MTPQHAWTRCLIVAASDTEASEAVAMVTARDWQPQVVHHPYQAMVDLCIRHRAKTLRIAWGLPSHEQLACVVVNPSVWPELAEFLRASASYLPETTMLSFDHGTLSRIGVTQTAPKIDTSMARAVLERKSPPPPTERLASATPGIASPPRRPLRLAETDSQPALDEPNPESASPSTSDEDLSPGITPEEIEMLLSTQPGEDSEP